MKIIRDIAIWIAITVWINFYPDRYRYDTVPQGRHGYWHINHPWYPYARFLLPLLLAVWIAYKHCQKRKEVGLHTKGRLKPDLGFQTTFLSIRAS